jgi:hypothetical protein
MTLSRYWLCKVILSRVFTPTAFHFNYYNSYSQILAERFCDKLGSETIGSTIDKLLYRQWRKKQCIFYCCRPMLVYFSAICKRVCQLLLHCSEQEMRDWHEKHFNASCALFYTYFSDTSQAIEGISPITTFRTLITWTGLKRNWQVSFHDFFNTTKVIPIS